MQSASLSLVTNKRIWRQLLMAGVVLLIPSILSVINVPAVMGYKIHLFPLAVFLAAMLYGSVGGAMAGLTGSIYSAWTLGNPYLIVGNVLLGLVAGWLIKRRWPLIVAVAVAFAVQLPWLVLTDYYLVHLPAVFIKSLVSALALSNLIWVLVIQLGRSYLPKLVKNTDA